MNRIAWWWRLSRRCDRNGPRWENWCCIPVGGTARHCPTLVKCSFEICPLKPLPWKEIEAILARQLRDMIRNDAEIRRLGL